MTRVAVSGSILRWAIERSGKASTVRAKVSEGAGVGAWREPAHLAAARKDGRKSEEARSSAFGTRQVRGCGGGLPLVDQRLVKTSVGW